MIKNFLSKAYKLYPIWIIFTAIFYFFGGQPFFESFNPGVGFLQIIFYFNLVVFGGFLFTLIVPLLIKLLKINRLNILHFLLLLFLTSIFVNILSLSRGYSVYNGYDIIRTETGMKFYENEQIGFDDIVLQNGQFISDEKKSALGLPDQFSASFERLTFVDALVGISTHIGIVYLKLFLILFSIFGAGILPLKLFSRENNLKNMIFAFGLGTMVFSLTLFFLARFSYLNFTSVIFVAGAFFIAGLSQLKNLLVLIKEASVGKKDITTVWLILVYSLSVFLSWNFSEAMEPLPIGFDDASLYLNLPNLIAHFGQLINNNGYYAFSLIQGAAQILDPEGGLKKILIPAFGALSIFPVYLLLREFFNKKYSILGVAVLFLTPTIFVHNFLQIKVEMPLLFFGTSSIYATLLWIKEKNIKFLALAGLLAGFAFTIKITTTFLIVALISSVALELFSTYVGIWVFLFFFTALTFTQNFSGERPSIVENLFLRNIFLSIVCLLGLFVLIKSIKDKVFTCKKVLHIIILGFFLMIPVLPWAISNMIENKDFGINSALYNNKVEFSIDGLSSYACSNEGFANLDYERYLPGHGGRFLDFLFLPWDLTMTTSAKSIITDLGFLFLAICPAGLFIYEKKKLGSFALFGIFFWILWGISAKGVIWYGFSGLVFIIILFTRSFISLSESNKLSKFSASIAVLIFLSISFFFRSNMFISRTHSFVPYYAGVGTYTNYVDNLYPEYRNIAGILNSDITAKIYLTDNVFIQYFIDENNLRVMRDGYLDVFACLDSNGTAVEGLKNNFDYLVISTPVNDPDFGEGLFDRASRLLKISEENFTLVGVSKDSYLFKTK